MQDKAPQPIPDGFHSVTPYFTVADPAGLIDFLKAAFNAQEIHCSRGPDGHINHAQMKVGDSMVMLGQARDEWPPMPAAIYLYVEDADALHARALAAGAEEVMPIADMPYGDRHGGVRDTNGNVWFISTHVKDIPHGE